MMIQAFHLTKVHPSGVKTLDDAHFSATEGSFTVIVGESRTGKSTFLRILGGEEKPTSGVLRVDHKDIHSLSSREKREWLSEVGLVLSDLTLFPEKTVEENILFILQMKGAAGEGDREAIRKLLAKAGLGSKIGAKPKDLSSGEHRMVLALRSMIFRPRLLLADEPFQGLDEASVAVLSKFFLELHKGGCTIVLSTQEASFLTELRKQGAQGSIQWTKLEKGRLWPMEAL
ncbi:MAG TPA: ATP-binding cassette domain-containing protein [bacterium]|nr:ATP-binding cassette domain-containing protein [bacterium]